MNDLVHSGVLLPEQNQNDEQSMNHNSHHYKVYKREPEKRYFVSFWSCFSYWLCVTRKIVRAKVVVFIATDDNQFHTIK